jgi:hypothetical protein
MHLSLCGGPEGFHIRLFGLPRKAKSGNNAALKLVCRYGRRLSRKLDRFVITL